MATRAARKQCCLADADHSRVLLCWIICARGLAAKMLWNLDCDPKLFWWYANAAQTYLGWIKYTQHCKQNPEGFSQGKYLLACFCFNVISSVVEERFEPGRLFSQICFCDVESALACCPWAWGHSRLTACFIRAVKDDANLAELSERRQIALLFKSHLMAPVILF